MRFRDAGDADPSPDSCAVVVAVVVGADDFSLVAVSSFISSRNNRRNNLCSASGVSRAGSYDLSPFTSALPLRSSEMRTNAPVSNPSVSSDWKRNSDSRGV